MVTDKDADAHAERMYYAERRRVRRGLIAPIVFFVVLGGVILASVIGYRYNQRAGKVEPEGDAVTVNYLCIPLGSTIYENVDPIDDSYGDYLYIGSDFFEVGVDYEIAIYDHTGVVRWDGTDTVETMTWTCAGDAVTREELAAMAENLATAFGDYGETEGTWVWHADTDGNMLDNKNIARMSCGLNGNGDLVIEGMAN